MNRKTPAVPISLFLATVVGCHTPSTTAFPKPVAAQTEATVGGAPLTWNALTPEVFARAQREKKLVLLDGAAEWCHFCHVMDETTYADGRVRDYLAKHFILARVDVDERPDVEERYAAWGWPATIIFTSGAEELEKYRGYIPPPAFLDILRSNVAKGETVEVETKRSGDGTPDAPAVPLTRADYIVLKKTAEGRLEREWDAARKGWGKEPKVPLGTTTAYALSRAERGDESLKQKGLAILDAQLAIIDPVWGGIYQYSVAEDWAHPHFEKLMYYNAPALANYASAYALTHEPRFLEGAKEIRRYLEAFLRAEDGGFHPTQDADFNSRDERARKMTGEDYHKKNDEQRRALGIPRVDPHEYADATAMAVSAYVSLYEATNDKSALAIAKEGAKHLITRHLTKEGAVSHDVLPTDGTMPKVFYLSDAVHTAWALHRVAQFQDEGDRTRHVDVALWMQRALETKNGAFFAHTKEAMPVTGVFAERRVPLEENMLAARLLLAIHEERISLYQRSAKGTMPRFDVESDVFRRMAERTLSVTVTPASIERRGKFLGAELLALDAWLATYPN